MKKRSQGIGQSIGSLGVGAPSNSTGIRNDVLVAMRGGEDFIHERL